MLLGLLRSTERLNPKGVDSSIIGERGFGNRLAGFVGLAVTVRAALLATEPPKPPPICVPNAGRVGVHGVVSLVLAVAVGEPADCTYHRRPCCPDHRWACRKASQA